MGDESHQLLQNNGSIINHTYSYIKIVITIFSLWKNGDKSARPTKFRSGKYFMTLVYNQSGFKINSGKLSFSHEVNEIPLSFEIGNTFDLLTIKQIEIYNDDPYKGRIQG
ncbi:MULTISPECIES: hypothetical protein [unclassified Methanosarcina]|uniref:hypothetical protein n=1 Tax=unclassified Methanosarcina TaxID=2644672 RepID=UPI00064EDF33|nr:MULTISPECIES: hypothetical protein [unclassified Methanosarcina]